VLCQAAAFLHPVVQAGYELGLLLLLPGGLLAALHQGGLLALQCHLLTVLLSVQLPSLLLLLLLLVVQLHWGQLCCGVPLCL
jgi:hypothetical protein